jgi:hypothetical protein
MKYIDEVVWRGTYILSLIKIRSEIQVTLMILLHQLGDCSFAAIDERK